MIKSRSYYSISVYYKRLIRLGFVLALGVLIFGQLFFNQNFLNPVFSDDPSVVISEIGWMGTSSSYTDEWLEIHNPSSQKVNLSGWTLKSADGVPDVPLSGDIEANGFCLLERTDDNSIPDIKADFVYTGDLGNSGEKLELINSQGGVIDTIDSSGGWFAGDNSSKKSMERIDPLVSGSEPTNWQTSTDSPGTPRTEGCNALASEDSQPTLQKNVAFNAPSSVTAAAEFTVMVNLLNFDPGTYHFKVLVGKGDSFIYGNTKSGSEWLTQNGAWAEMPSVAVGSSGTASKAVKAKVDVDAVAGSYKIKVRVNGDGNNYDSAEKALAVKSAPAISESAVATGDTGNPENFGNLGGAGDSYAVDPYPEGQVLGEKSSPDKPFQLNFYIIVGIFGLIVGSGGLVLAFRYLKNSSVAAR